MQLALVAVMFQQFIILPHFFDLAFIQHNNFIGFADGLKTVGNYNRSPSFN
jgi:hypothetical protein